MIKVILQLCIFALFSFKQDEVNQVVTINVWLEQVCWKHYCLLLLNWDLRYLS